MADDDKKDVMGELAAQDTYSAADVPMPTPRPNLLEQARQEYPVLNNYDIGYKESPGKGQGYMESFPPGEQGSSQNPRPSEFPLNQFGVENYRPDSKASDVMADITSHHLVNVDPTVKQTYQGFAASLQPFQHDILAQQYQHAVQNEGETRPFEQWRDAAGLPGMFRGYAFDQWPKEFTDQAYTPQQKQKLDDMVKYLKGTRSDLSPDETQMQPPQNAVGGLTPEDWMMSGQQPPAATYDYVPPQSWLQKAGDLARRDVATYQQGGVPAMMGQLAEDSSGEQDLAGGFGGNIKGVESKLGAIADLAPHAPPFYSAVENAVAGAKQTTAPGQQWAGFLRNQPGVKPEELNTLKLGDLFDQTGAVTKQDLLDHIAANKVQLGEVVKGGPTEPTSLTEARENYQRLSQGRNPDLYPAEFNAAADRYEQEVTAHQEQGGSRFSADPTKFSQYTLPGGENYRETLLTLPTSQQAAARSARMTALEEKLRNAGDYDIPEVKAMRQEYKQLADEMRGDQTFQSSHFDEPNILAHIRTNDRVIDGKKTLFVEEVQSDWHQKGKRYGYQGSEPASWTSTGSEGVPDAPFKTTWPDLAMKRVIRQAAEGGYDKVAWTPGSVQADRYDLSKHIDKITYDGQRLWAWKKGEQGSPAINQSVAPEGLADVIGKDAADRLMQQPEQTMSKFQPNGPRSYRTLEGADLKIGGEGMKGFYDQILPATVNKLVKKHGGRVEQGQLAGPESAKAIEDNGEAWLEFRGQRSRYGNMDEARARANEINSSAPSETSHRVHTLDITPSLRAAAMKGFPLFTAGGIAATGMMGDLAKQDDYQ